LPSQSRSSIGPCEADTHPSTTPHRVQVSSRRLARLALARHRRGAACRRLFRHQRS
jgi:hypothetical protein